MVGRPWISVLLPTYQGAALLPRALASIAGQADAASIEVVAVDDGSTDGTLEILNAWQDRLHLQIITVPHNGNWVANTNRALQRARGEWISWLHQDDAWLPGRVARLHALTLQYPEVDLFLHPAEFRDMNDRRLGYWRAPLSPGRPLGRVDVWPKLVRQNTVPIVAPLVKREKCAETGPMDEDLWYFADWDYWLRLAMTATWYYHPEPLALFRIHHGSQTVKRTHSLEEIGRQFDTVTGRALAAYPMPGRTASRWRRRVAFARAAYQCMLAGFHGAPGTLGAFIRAALRVGPIEWWRYTQAAALRDRVGPRVRLWVTREVFRAED